jgi:hypothetical protein
MSYRFRRLVLALGSIVSAVAGTVSLSISTPDFDPNAPINDRAFHESAGIPVTQTTTVSISATGAGTTNFTVSVAVGVPNILKVSKDGVNFSSSVSGTINAGGAPQTVIVSISNTTLHANKPNEHYSGQIVFSGNNLVSTPPPVEVDLIVDGVDVTAPSSVSVPVTIGKTASNNSVPVSVSIPVTVNIASTQTWLTMGGTQSTQFAINQIRSIGYEVNAGKLPVGTSMGMLQITCPPGGSPCQEVDVMVMANVASNGTIQMISDVTFRGNVGGSSPPSQTIQINTSDGSTIGVSVTKSASASWLLFNAPTSAPGQLVLQASVGNMTADTYTGVVTVTPANGNAAVSFNVTLIVSPPTSTTLKTSTSSLRFNAAPGGNSPPAQTFQVTASDGSGVGITVTSSTTDGGTWLSFTPSSMTTPATISVTVTPGSLTANTYNGQIRIDAANGAPSQTVSIQLVIGQSTSFLLSLPHLAAGSTWTTGVSIVNNGNQAANYSISFFDSNGQPLTLPFSNGATSTLSGVIPAQGAAYFEASNPAGSLVVGSATIMADPSIVVQALFRDQVGAVYYEAAVPSETPSKEFVIPFDATTFGGNGAQIYTGFAIANPDTVNAVVNCTARDSSGTVIPDALTVPQLPPNGHFAGYQFPPLLGKRGTLDCSSNANIAATALRFLGNDAFSSLPVITLPASSALAPTLSLPHLAAGDVWTTGINVVNDGNVSASFTISFFDSNGNPLTLPFAGGATNKLTGGIPAHGSAYFEASNPAGQLVVGSGQITSDSSIIVQALFRDKVGNLYYEAAVPAATPSKEFLIPFDATKFAANGAQIYTGFAIANVDATAATITCTARDLSGNLIPNAVSIPQLTPMGHFAGYQFPVLQGKQGTLDCSSNTNVAATALRFLGTDAFSSLPVITK